MLWDYVLRLLSFTGVRDVAVWQDVFFGVLLIPPAVEALRIFFGWLRNKRPLRLLLEGYLSENTRILVFLSQLSALDDKGQLDHNPKYAVKYPKPTPTEKRALDLQFKQNIDPVWPEGDGECLADIYNVLGKAGKGGDIEVGDLINDWDVWSQPIFTIGFNPKTRKLMEKCDPVYFDMKADNRGFPNLGIEGCDTRLGSVMPNDAAVVQNTFLEDSNTPVFILAGLGTTGTSAAGYFLRENCVSIGRLYGDKAFCFLLRVRMDEGRTAVVMQDVCPKPPLSRVVLYPITYFSFFRKPIFSDAHL